MGTLSYRPPRTLFELGRARVVCVFADDDAHLEIQGEIRELEAVGLAAVLPALAQLLVRERGAHLERFSTPVETR